MGFSLIPRYKFPQVTDISPIFLIKTGIKLLMLDIDNTIATYDAPAPPIEIVDWVSALKDNGIFVTIVSNSSRVARVTKFAEDLEIAFIANSGKPSPRALLTTMYIANFSENESALLGDQIFTDTLAANRAGIISIIVKPKKLTNPFFALRYLIELPIRALVTKRR